MSLHLDSKSQTAGDFLSAALVLYSVEMVVGGPGFLYGGHLAPRSILFGLLTFATINYYLKSPLSIGKWQKLLICHLIVFLLVWVIAIPSIHSEVQVKNSIRECLFFASAFTGILLIKVAQNQPELFKTSGRAIVISLDIVALAICCIWMAGSINNDIQIELNTYTKWFFRPFGPPEDLAIYIGPMPDGAFRVMWITSTLICLGGIYAYQQGMLFRSALYIVACAASYARGLWLALAIGILLLTAIELINKHRKPTLWARRISGLALGLLASILLLYSHSHEPATRLSFDDPATSIRMEQMKALLDMWSRSPIMGHGFGAYAQTIIRNPKMPWSYEMTYPALLMKTGLAGVLLLLIGCYSLIKETSPQKAGYWRIFPYILAIFVYSGTNPYLLNVVGFSAIFCVLLILASHRTERVAPPPLHYGGLA